MLDVVYGPDQAFQFAAMMANMSSVTYLDLSTSDCDNQIMVSPELFKALSKLVSLLKLDLTGLHCHPSCWTAFGQTLQKLTRLEVRCTTALSHRGVPSMYSVAGVVSI